MKCRGCKTDILTGCAQYCSDACRATGQYVYPICPGCQQHFRTVKCRPNATCSRKCRALVDDYTTINIKRTQTVIKKYGVTHPLHVAKFKQKQLDTNLKTYGTDNPAKSKIIKSKISTDRKHRDYTRLLRLYRDKCIPQFTFAEFAIGTRDTNFKFECATCHNFFTDNIKDGILPRCYQCDPILTGQSHAENDVADYISQFAKVERKNTLLIAPTHLDIVIPTHNLAIEYNGVYWHSELAGKTPNYHLKKTQRCNVIGLQLVHIFESEWLHKNDIVCSILRNKVAPHLNRKIFARKCTIRPVNVEESRQFLDENHIQGYSTASIRIGLYENEVLVELLTFGKARYNAAFEYELLRHCVARYTTVVGGLRRLFTHFCKTFNPSSIITYSDRRFFIGQSYLSINFSLLDSTPPKYYYFQRGTMELQSRERFQKHKLASQLKTFDASLTEWENMQLNGYNRIWDCGNWKFVWKSS